MIEYLITIAGPEPADRQENLLDYEHYINRQIRPVVDQVLPILERDFDEIRPSTSWASFQDPYRRLNFVISSDSDVRPPPRPSLPRRDDVGLIEQTQA